MNFTFLGFFIISLLHWGVMRCYDFFFLIPL